MPKAVIVGGGIAGLASGIAFEKAGWDVEILERAASIEPMGAALSLWPNAAEALSLLGIADAVADAAAPIRSLRLADQHDRQIFERPSAPNAVLITRTALQKALLNGLGAISPRLNCAVDKIEPGKVILTDGQVLSCDLAVNAAGIRSPGQGTGRPRYAGYGGVLALTNSITGPGLNGRAAEYWGTHERFGVFELPGARRYWFYMRSQSANAAMPNLAECQTRATEWPEPVREALSATDTGALVPYAIYARTSPKTLYGPGLVRVGDAAHAMEPNQGQGACQALEDAAALQVIAAACPPTDIGRVYDRMRLRRARMCVKESARMRYSAHGPMLVQSLMKNVFRALPDSIVERAMTRIQTMPDYPGIMRKMRGWN